MFLGNVIGLSLLLFSCLQCVEIVYYFNSLSVIDKRMVACKLILHVEIHILDSYGAIYSDIL
mgnify:CR=1 FL=1